MSTCNDAVVGHRCCWDRALLCPTLDLEALREFGQVGSKGTAEWDLDSEEVG